MLQPALEVASTSQFVPRMEPLERPLLVMVQPASVWRVIWLVEAALTFSIMSTSPEVGQLGPRSQLWREGVSRGGEVGRGNVQSGPGAADAAGHVFEVQDYEAVVVGCCTGYSDA
jgi:hypothetical protein